MTSSFMRGILWVAMIGLVCGTFGCAKAPEGTLYADQAEGFSLVVPPGWHLQAFSSESGPSGSGPNAASAQLARQVGISLVLSQYPLGDKSVLYNPNISVSLKTIEPTVEPLTHGAWVEKARQALLSLAPQAGTGNIHIDGRHEPARVWSTYQYSLPALRENVDIFTLSTIVIDKQRSAFFLLTASCRLTDSPIFLPIFNKTTDSFRILEEKEG